MKILRWQIGAKSDPLTDDVPIHTIGSDGTERVIGKVKSDAHLRVEAEKLASAKTRNVIPGHFEIITYTSEPPKTR